jgi:hypothetical protein
VIELPCGLQRRGTHSSADAGRSESTDTIMYIRSGHFARLGAANHPQEAHIKTLETCLMRFEIAGTQT